MSKFYWVADRHGRPMLMFNPPLTSNDGVTFSQTDSIEQEKKRYENPVPVNIVDRYKNPIILADAEEYGLNGETFVMGCPIGEACRGGLRVYRAIRLANDEITKYSPDIRKLYVAVKYVNMEKQPEIFNRMRMEVCRSRHVQGYRNILGCRREFYDINGGHYVVVLPHMDRGSLRSVMAADRRFHRGLPENYTLYFLYETLKGLSVIHRLGLVHGQICAGHIFLDSKGQVELAYSASVYDLDIDQHGHRIGSTSFMPTSLSCDWAAAPEVYGSTEEEASDKDNKPADIWMIGITALELAYGGLRFVNREELEAMMVEINKKKRLRTKCADHGDRKKLLPFVPSCLNPEHTSKKKRGFSKEFVNMVVECLDFDPSNRPTADELLEYKIFNSVRYWFFYKPRQFLPFL